MPRLPNRSDDLTPAGERKRKQRGTNDLTKIEAGEGMEIEPNPEWHPTARMIWDSGLTSGQSDLYEASDWSVLYLTCEGLSHWLEQGARKSPELLRVLMTNLSGLLFTEADRRKVQVELTKPDTSHSDILASVESLFPTDMEVPK